MHGSKRWAWRSTATPGAGTRASPSCFSTASGTAPRRQRSPAAARRGGALKGRRRRARSSAGCARSPTLRARAGSLPRARASSARSECACGSPRAARPRARTQMPPPPGSRAWRRGPPPPHSDACLPAPMRTAAVARLRVLVSATRPGQAVRVHLAAKGAPLRRKCCAIAPECSCCPGADLGRSRATPFRARCVP